MDSIKLRICSGPTIIADIPKKEIIEIKRKALGTIPDEFKKVVHRE